MDQERLIEPFKRFVEALESKPQLSWYEENDLFGTEELIEGKRYQRYDFLMAQNYSDEQFDELSAAFAEGFKRYAKQNPPTKLDIFNVGNIRLTKDLYYLDRLLINHTELTKDGVTTKAIYFLKPVDSPDAEAFYASRKDVCDLTNQVLKERGQPTLPAFQFDTQNSRIIPKVENDN